jgi:hypothetical protein
MSRLGFVRFVEVCAVAAALAFGSAAARAQETPGERFAAAVALVEGKQLVEARAAFDALLSEYDTPENRQNIEYDSLLAGSSYYLGTYLRRTASEEAAKHLTVIGAFRTYHQPEPLPPGSRSTTGRTTPGDHDARRAGGAVPRLPARPSGALLPGRLPRAAQGQGSGASRLQDDDRALSTARVDEESPGEDT